VAKQVFSLLLSLGLSDGFKIVSTSQTEKVHQPGDTVTLVCRADSYWEYCSWSHKQRKCDLEWKYSKGHVVKQDCHVDLDPRLIYSGNYEKHECSITISSLQLGDAGSWSCEMESYVLGSTRGYKSRNKIEVVIEAKTTTGTTKQTTTESLPTTLGSTTTEGTTATFTTTTTEDTKVLPEQDHSDTEQEEESQHRNHTDLEDLDTDEVVTALPVSDMEAAPSQASAGLIAGVIVCLAAMGLVIAGLGVKHYRRRKSQRAIISYLQAERDDAMASNAFLEEAEYHISIIRDPQALPLSVTNTRTSDILDNSVTEVLTVSDTKET